MIPLLAPLLGSLAGSLLPATFGTGIASALGLSGAAGGLIAAAAPKAIGAGIGTLLAGGDLGDAALNAVGFGAGSTALSSLMGGAPGAATSAAGTTNAGKAVQALTQTFGGQPQAAPARMMMKDARDILVPRDQSSAGFGLPAGALNQQAGATDSALFAGAPPQPPMMAPPPTVPVMAGPPTMPASASMGIGSIGYSRMQDPRMFPQNGMMRGIV